MGAGYGNRGDPATGEPRSAVATRSGRLGTVRDWMSRNPVTVSPEALLTEAAREMLDRKLGALAVVEADRPIGILTKSDARKRSSRGPRGRRRLRHDQARAGMGAGGAGRLGSRHRSGSWGAAERPLGPEARRPHAEDRDERGRGAGPGRLPGLAAVRRLPAVA
ncbi:MAG: CBS domain-containing protein [Candidatus Rokubacteria bacterium]|nr:CBS domain-containing protein [Candidatus Rokubacteria bacterium]